MASRPLIRRRHGHGAHVDRRRLVPRSRRVGDVPAEVRDRRDGHGRRADGETDRNGLAHVISRHPRVGEAHRERERRNQDRGEYTDILTAEWSAESA